MKSSQARRVGVVEEARGHDTPCWIFTGHRTREGYGQIRIDGRLGYAHRVYYERHVGPIPDGLQIDHLCRVPACCNPAHLEAVTNRENSRRSAKAKLTPDDVREIRALVHTTSRAELARRFGVTWRAIDYVVKRVTWSDIEDEREAA